MNVKTLDGKVYKWKLDHTRQPRSKLHKRAVDIFYDEYPNVRVYNEVSIKTQHKPSRTLYLDIYVPTFNIAVEINGEQHETFIPFFHASDRDLVKQKIHDFEKSEWCNINGIQLITLSYSETKDEWRQKLISATKHST